MADSKQKQPKPKQPPPKAQPKKPQRDPTEARLASDQQLDSSQTAKKSQSIDRPVKKSEAPPLDPPYLTYRSKSGIKLIKTLYSDAICKESINLAETPNSKENRIESACCSEDGELLAWCDNTAIKCIKFATQEVVFEQPNTHKSNSLLISPRSTKLVAYSTMTGGDNLHFWDLSTQTHLGAMSFKRASVWKPTFSMNEDICLQHVNSELLLYAGKFDKPKQRISHIKVDDFSLSTASALNNSYQHIYDKRIKNKSHYIAIYSAGTKGQPSLVKIYKYPNMNDCVTNKSFFKADTVKFSWSPSGNSLLLTCQTDFDPSSKSYYGEQSLNFLNTQGESYFVKLPKEGAINHIEWFPGCDTDMFVCVYGLQPAKVSLFNNKCEVIFNFGDQGSFNGAMFNPFGNMLAIYGFGNLAGQLNIWDFVKKKLITTVKVPETTGIEWCADGKHLMTRTTTPRLRVGNGFRLWNYAGNLLYEEVASNDPAENIELYDVFWQPQPGKHVKPKPVIKTAAQMPNLLTQSKIGKFQGSAGKYVPPSMRNANANSSVSFIDSAVGKGAGNRLIVGLESLNLSKQQNPKKGPKQKNITAN